MVILPIIMNDSVMTSQTFFVYVGAGDHSFTRLRAQTQDRTEPNCGVRSQKGN